MQFQPPANSRPQHDLRAEEYTSLVERFLAALDAQPNTKRTYRRSLRQFFLYLEKHKISRPRREDILAFKQWLRDQGKSACYLSNLLTATRKFFQYLASERIYPDVAQGIRGTKPAWGLRDPLSIADTKKLLASIDRSTLLGKRDYALINLMVRTGPRTIELRRSNIEDIRTVGGEQVLYLQGKGEESKSAFVVLTPATYQPLMDYLRSRGPMRPSDPIFSSLSDADIFRLEYPCLSAIDWAMRIILPASKLRHLSIGLVSSSGVVP
jgi:site-specific recombinase XerD